MTAFWLRMCAEGCRSLPTAWRLQGPTQGEWAAARAAAQGLGKAGIELSEQMGKTSCALVMDYVPGTAFCEASEPFQPELVHQTASDLGRQASVGLPEGSPV